jgi:hypothetical protein
MNVKKNKEITMVFRKIFFALIVMSTLIATTVWAGDVARIGTTSGTQVQVPVGGRTFAMNGSDLVQTSGLDALYWNPAGLASMGTRAEGLFSTMNYVADISINYFAAGFNMGKVGQFGVSAKSFSIGDIPVTTINDMDGESGQTFSPNMSTIGLTYANGLTDRISVGVTAKMIIESIPRAEASAFAMDIGLQYKSLMDIENLGLGVVIKNIGSSMKYGGTAMLITAEDAALEYSDYRYIPTTKDQIPATFELGATYKLDMGAAGALLAASYQSNHSENDYLRFGAEIGVNDLVFVRGGYSLTMEDPDNPDLGETLFSGITAGAGLKLSMMGANMLIDYTYRPVEFSFSDNQVFSIGFVF